MGERDDLATERLLLRRVRPEDLDPLARINADPEVARHLTGRPMTRDETAALLERVRQHWSRWGYGLWAVDHLADRRTIGLAGLAHHVWYPEDVEVGWRLGTDYWGRGLATEAAAAALRHGFERLGLRRIISVIHEVNVASRRVAEKNGLRVWKRAIHPKPGDGEPLPIVVYEIERAD